MKAPRTHGCEENELWPTFHGPTFEKENKTSISSFRAKGTSSPPARLPGSGAGKPLPDPGLRKTKGRRTFNNSSTEGFAYPAIPPFSRWPADMLSLSVLLVQVPDGGVGAFPLPSPEFLKMLVKRKMMLSEQSLNLKKTEESHNRQ